jgi:serine/threonine-protein kinase
MQNGLSKAKGHIMIGEQLGKHSILAEIGRGGMGTVYEAEDSTLGRKVAIKLLNPALLGKGGKELERFQAEARIQANLNHPNIVTLHDIQPHQDSYYMVMEYVEGKTLAQLVKSYGALPSNIVVAISKQVLDALAAAHRHKVVHRDLKPANIMLTPEGLAKVMDFGIAKAEGSKHLTATGAIVGTVFYMSPEQVRGEILDARSDIYSFGIILFELLTGRVPFQADSDFSIMVQHVRSAPPPPTQLLPEIPAVLEEIVLKCLAKDPKARFQTAEELAAALGSWEEQQHAFGRGHLYTQASLAQWLAAPDSEPAGITPEPEAPAQVPALPSGHLADATAAPLSVSKGKTWTRWWLLPLILILLTGAAGSYWLIRDQPSGEQPVEIAETAVPAERIDETPPKQPAKSAEPVAAVAEPEPAPPVRDSPAAVTSPPAAAIPPDQAEEEPAPVMKEARGFIVFLNLDDSGENLPLGMAQTRVTEILREAEQEVVSSSVIAAHVRTSLDSGNLEEVRSSGIGYILVGTAHGTLEPREAYGTMYYAGQVSVALELLQTTDGSIAATGSGEAKSRGSENREVALRDALLTAASEATRSLLRNYQP